MKRDMDLVRKILFALEAKTDDTLSRNLIVDGYEMVVVAYHCKMMYEEGLIKEYRPMESDFGLHGFQVGSLTWDGHDFLENIRQDTVWNKTKDTVLKKGLSMTLDIVKAVAASIMSEMVKKAIGG